MNTITTVSEASAFQQGQVTQAVATAVAVKTSDTQKQEAGGVLELLSAAMAVVEAALAPPANLGKKVDVVA